MSQESPHTHYGRGNRAHKTPCEAMAARQIEEGLRGGDYDSEELVRWYWSLDNIMDLTWNEAPHDDAYDQARRLRHRVMRAMSATLPARRVALARVTCQQGTRSSITSGLQGCAARKHTGTIRLLCRPGCLTVGWWLWTERTGLRQPVKMARRT